MSFLNELKRRNVLRVGAAYIVAAWLIIQVAETIFPLFGFGDAPARIVVTVLAIGFPLFLLFSWVFEITPDGLKRETEIERSLSTTHKTGKQLDRIIIVLLALALGYFAFDKFIFDPARDQSKVEVARQEGRTEALLESYGDQSIAVLPFVNMSSDPEQEYFSDGISEELLNVLSRIPELRVISRSSAFTYKGKDIDIPTIAEQLNVAHILEGSVRKAGNQVRITVQLIEARSDTHLWSETYDRKLDDIFAIQDEIAKSVVAKLKVTLLGPLPTVNTTRADAFSMYLKAKQLSRNRSPDDLKQAQLLLEQALKIDKSFAPAWNRLSIVYTDLAENGLIPRDEGYALARLADEEAILADPGFASSYAGLAWICLSYDKSFANAAQYLQRALEIDPYNTAVISDSAALLKMLGRLEEAIFLEKLNIRRDPLSPGKHNNLAVSYFFAGHLDEAEDYFRKLLELSPKYSRGHTRLGMVLLAKHESISALEIINREVNEVSRIFGLTLAYFDNGDIGRSDEVFGQLVKDFPEQYGYIAMAHAHRGEIDNAFQALKHLYDQGGSSQELRVDPIWEPLRSDKRWTDLLVRAGLSDEQVQRIQLNIPAYD